MYSWLCWVLFAARAFSNSGERRLLSSCSPQVCRCCGFSWCGARSLGCGLQQLRLLCSQSTGSIVAGRGLRGIRDPPSSGIEPTCPALVGGFFTTEPPGKSWHLLLLLGPPACLAFSGISEGGLQSCPETDFWVGQKYKAIFLILNLDNLSTWRSFSPVPIRVIFNKPHWNLGFWKKNSL